MVELRMDAAAVAALARSVLQTADRIDAIGWPELDPADLAGSAVARAAHHEDLRDRVAEVTALLRTWAAAAQGSTATLDSAELRHAGRLRSPR